ncbi:hypothetical protein BDV96DRAFT_585067 [Lophiotrema nucula]|uniref:F-box domain-containing protein n=1 Tax=Lophiotrema nucula TaxID=690887 RepID=A0A6A5YQV8_9PLEO|nr:hypothetical protein BDV96DRAFT_585067 [Lophiotrema nucula]
MPPKLDGEPPSPIPRSSSDELVQLYIKHQRWPPYIHGDPWKEVRKRAVTDMALGFRPPKLPKLGHHDFSVDRAWDDSGLSKLPEELRLSILEQLSWEEWRRIANTNRAIFQTVSKKIFRYLRINLHDRSPDFPELPTCSPFLADRLAANTDEVEIDLSYTPAAQRYAIKFIHCLKSDYLFVLKFSSDSEAIAYVLETLGDMLSKPGMLREIQFPHYAPSQRRQTQSNRNNKLMKGSTLVDELVSPFEACFAFFVERDIHGSVKQEDVVFGLRGKNKDKGGSRVHEAGLLVGSFQSRFQLHRVCLEDLGQAKQGDLKRLLDLLNLPKSDLCHVEALHVKFIDFNVIQPDEFERLISADLRELRLEECSNIYRLLNYLRKRTHDIQLGELHIIALSETSFFKGGSSFLRIFLQSFHNLTTLSIVTNEITTLDVLDFIQTHTKLKHLHYCVGPVQLSNTSMEALIGLCPNLREIGLYNTELYDRRYWQPTIRGPSNASEFIPSITSLIEKHLSQLSDLESVVLYNSNPGEADASFNHHDLEEAMKILGSAAVKLGATKVKRVGALRFARNYPKPRFDLSSIFSAPKMLLFDSSPGENGEVRLTEVYEHGLKCHKTRL